MGAVGYPIRSKSAGGAAGFILTRRPGVGSEIFMAQTGPTVVASGTPLGTFGAWVALGGALAADLYLTRLQARRTVIPATLANFAVEFAYAAGATAVDAMRQQNSIVDGPPANDAGFLAADLNTYNTKIPSGGTLSSRITDGAGAVDWQVWVCGWSGSLPAFTRLSAASPAGAGRYYPSNVSAGLAVVAAAYPNYGAWVQVVAAAPNDLLIMAVHHASSLPNTGSPGTAYQVGIGAAGQEVPVGISLAGRNLSNTNLEPPVWVKAGERLAVRASSAAAANRLAVVKVIDL